MDKKVYIRPEIVQELELETRAGSVITPQPGIGFPFPPDDGG